MTLLGFNLWSGPGLVHYGCKPFKARIEPWNLRTLETRVANLDECGSFKWNLNIGRTDFHSYSVCISISLFVCFLPDRTSFRPSLSLSFCLSICLSLCLSACLPAWLCLWVCMSACLPAFQPSCLPVCLLSSLCVCLCLSASVCVCLTKQAQRQAVLLIHSLHLLLKFCTWGNYVSTWEAGEDLSERHLGAWDIGVG